jgi:DNA modification methylase
MVERFLGDRVMLHAGDCREVLVTLPECSIDSCVTDPPYHLTSIVKRMSAEDAAPVDFGSDGRYQRLSGGFMGKLWDGGDIAFDPATWRAVWRVLKPGAHLLAMGGTRTFHRLACAIEDAGFEIRDTISWLYGSGFPKSHDVSKGIDRAAGAERDVVGFRRPEGSGVAGAAAPDQSGSHIWTGALRSQSAITDAARQWEGWGTALKPACELIVLARKPLSEGTVAANVLRWGTGAINVDECRVGTETTIIKKSFNLGAQGGHDGWSRPWSTTGERWEQRENATGRWPANLVHDGSDEVTAAFPDAGAQGQVSRQNTHENNSRGDFVRLEKEFPFYADSGSAARFFYTAKADADDRLGSKHPTVKPLDLMQWLVRLVTPRRGLVLDPFAGTGTTGEAAWREDMRAVLIEAESEYQADIRRRMALALAGPDERVRESIKARNLPRDDGPLFAPRETYDATDDFARSIEEVR